MDCDDWSALDWPDTGIESTVDTWNKWLEIQYNLAYPDFNLLQTLSAWLYCSW